MSTYDLLNDKDVNVQQISKHGHKEGRLYHLDIATDGNYAYSLYELLSNSAIFRSGMSTTRTDTFPIATSIIAAIGPNGYSDFRFDVLFVNLSSTQAVTLAATTGITLKGSPTINPLQSVKLMFVVRDSSNIDVYIITYNILNQAILTANNTFTGTNTFTQPITASTSVKTPVVDSGANVNLDFKRNGSTLFSLISGFSYFPSSITTDSFIKIWATSDTGASFMMGNRGRWIDFNTGSTKDWSIYAANSDKDLVFKDQKGATVDNVLYLKEGGNVGIGKTNPGTLLDVNGTGTMTGLAVTSLATVDTNGLTILAGGITRRAAHITATTVLTTADSDIEQFIDSAAAAVTITLPAPTTTGLRFRFTITNSALANNVSISSNTSNVLANIITSTGASTSGVSTTVRLNSATPPVRGEWLEFVSSGSSYWVRGWISTSGSLTYS